MVCDQGRRGDGDGDGEGGGVAVTVTIRRYTELVAKLAEKERDRRARRLGEE